MPTIPQLRTKLSGYFSKSRNQSPTDGKFNKIQQISSPTFLGTTSRRARELYNTTSTPPTPTASSYTSTPATTTPSTPLTPISASDLNAVFNSLQKINKENNPIPPQTGKAGGKIARNSWLKEEYVKETAGKSGFLNGDNYENDVPYVRSGLGNKTRDSVYGSKK